MLRQWSSLLMVMTIALLTACSNAAAPPTPTPTPIQLESTGTEPAETRRFVVVSEQSTASYVVNEEFFSGALAKYGIEAGNAEVIGSTNAVQGELRLNLADPTNALVAGRFAVNLPSLTTTRSQRDDWIRNNALESNKYPTAEFVATAIENAPASYTEGAEITFQLLGDLKVRDITLPVTFEVTATFRGDTITGVATAPMQLTDFGFDPPNFANTLTVANDFTIRVELTAKEQ